MAQTMVSSHPVIEEQHERTGRRDPRTSRHKQSARVESLLQATSGAIAFATGAAVLASRGGPMTMGFAALAGAVVSFTLSHRSHSHRPR